MDLNQIKKDLYKQKPLAYRIADGIDEKIGVFSLYRAKCTDHTVLFTVPRSDMGDHPFEDKVEGQLLIRWITNNK